MEKTIPSDAVHAAKDCEATENHFAQEGSLSMAFEIHSIRGHVPENTRGLGQRCCRQSVGGGNRYNAKAQGNRAADPNLGNSFIQPVQAGACE
jgi:hypothetical protein